MSDQIYEVVNIYRPYQVPISFIIVLYSQKFEYFRVSKKLNKKITQGFVYLADHIRITEMSDDGILFEIVPGDGEGVAHPESENLIYGDKGVLGPGMPEHLLPFLCDVMPYFTQESLETVTAVPQYSRGRFLGKYQIGNELVPNLFLPPPESFVAKVHQKTRINVYPTAYNPFFFLIVSTGQSSMKLVFWRESLKKYSSLKPGDVIYVRDHKPRRKLGPIERIEHNTFTESVYFDCEETTAKEICLIGTEGDRSVKRLFSTVEGTVSYVSVLLRCVINTSIMEYLLCVVDGQPVVLFYNSDENFYAITEGCSLRINELKKTVRAGMVVYISTIYTQFEVSSDGFDSLPSSQPVVEPAPSDTPQKRAPSEEPVRATKKPMPRLVSGAIGYLPDFYGSMEEILEPQERETVHGREIQVNLFMKPVVVSIEDLRQIDVMLNETRKYCVHSEILSVRESEVNVDYRQDGSVRKQGSWVVSLENNFRCYFFENFFLPGPGVAELKRLVGQRVYLFVEVFRIDFSTVLYHVTGVVDE